MIFYSLSEYFLCYYKMGTVMKISVTVHKYIPIRLRTFFCTVTGIVTTVWNGIRNRTEKNS